MRRLRMCADRVTLFLAIVYRPVTGPGRDEPPMTAWQCWRAYALDASTAWEVACIIHGRPQGGSR